MQAPVLPLSAYRADLSQSRGRVRLTQSDDDLIALGTLLSRCQQVRRHEGGADVALRLRRDCVAIAQRILRREARIPQPSSVVDPCAAPAAVAMLRDVADVAEDGEALRIADALLVLAFKEYGAEAGKLEQGRLLAQRARIARKRGDRESANAMYDEVRLWGGGISELRARADIGQAMLARERGNLPAMRRLFASALEQAQSSGSGEVVAKAHHGLMLAAAAAGQFGEAVLHAWAAFRGVQGDRVREGEALLNVAQAVLDLGHPVIALHTFVAALSRSLPKRMELPALGGAAQAAAAIGETGILHRLVARAQLLVVDDLGYDAVAAIAEVATALAVVHDPAAASWRVAALDAAKKSGFHEIVFRLENADAVTVDEPSSVPDSDMLRQVLDDVNSLDDWDALMVTI